MKLFASLATLVGAFIALTASEDPKCAYFSIPEWECVVCGGYSIDTPVVCSPFNATFEDLTLYQPVGIYKSTNWINFTTTNPKAAPYLEPYSGTSSQYAYAFPSGALTFGYNNGTESGVNQLPYGVLYSLYYGCVGACIVNLRGSCRKNFDESSPLTTYEMKMQFVPDHNSYSNLTFQASFPNWGICERYDVAATGANGTAVAVWFDEVLFHTYQKGFAG